MSAKLQGLPAGAGRHDPRAGAGDGEVVRGHLGTRIAQIIPTLLLVSILVFCLQQLMPGDPALVMAGEERGDPQVLAQIRAELWLDRSLPVQYLHWMGNVLQGNLGFSWRIRQPVAQLVFQKLPVTLQLGSMAFAIAVLIGVPAGNHRCGVPQWFLGLRRQRGGPGGAIHAELLARHHDDPADLGAVGLAAAIGLRAADRGLAAVARHHHHAGVRAGQRDRGGPDAAYPQCDADVARSGLCADGARQRVARVRRGDPACAAQCTDPGGDAGCAGTWARCSPVRC